MPGSPEVAKEALADALTEIWDGIPESPLESLYTSMPRRRVAAVIKAIPSINFLCSYLWPEVDPALLYLFVYPVSSYCSSRLGRATGCYFPDRWRAPAMATKRYAP